MQMSGYLRECCESEQSQNSGRHPEIISMVVLVEVQSSVLIINPGKLYREYLARMLFLNAWQSWKCWKRYFNTLWCNKHTAGQGNPCKIRARCYFKPIQLFAIGSVSYQRTGRCLVRSLILRKWIVADERLYWLIYFVCWMQLKSFVSKVPFQKWNEFKCKINSDSWESVCELWPRLSLKYLHIKKGWWYQQVKTSLRTSIGS